MGECLKHNEKCLRLRVSIASTSAGKWPLGYFGLTSHAEQVTAFSISARISLTVLLLASDLLGDARAPPRRLAR